MITVEGRTGVHLVSPVQILPDDREMAWAENHYRRHPALRYLLGHFLEAEKANNNGHIFVLDELKTAKETLANTPLNMLHRPSNICGHFLGSELMYPTSESSDEGTHPYLEALAAFYRYHLPDTFDVVEKAYKDGVLSFSMEAKPQSITCLGGCEKTWDYVGPSSPTYCSCIQEPGAPRRLNSPTFVGGALILPPVKPGWSQAEVTEMSALFAEHEDTAHRLYQEVAQTMPEMSAAQWEGTVGHLLQMAYGDWEGTEFTEYAKSLDIKQSDRDKWAKSGVALADGSFPIPDGDYLRRAIQSFGRSNPADRAKVKAHIVRRAKALGLSNMLPKDWS